MQSAKSRTLIGPEKQNHLPYDVPHLTRLLRSLSSRQLESEMLEHQFLIARPAVNCHDHGMKAVRRPKDSTPLHRAATAISPKCNYATITDAPFNDYNIPELKAMMCSLGEWQLG
jgi:hypothetical protein